MDRSDPERIFQVDASPNAAVSSGHEVVGGGGGGGGGGWGFSELRIDHPGLAR